MPDFPTPEDLTEQATLIGIIIRNALEDWHSSPEGPTDEQMAVLNPIIRDGALTALPAMWAKGRALDYAALQRMIVPGYWEEPKLLADYVDFVSKGSRSVFDNAAPPTPAGGPQRATCKKCDQPIMRMPGAKWLHDDPDRSRGCRAASYRSGVALYDEGRSHWDDRLARSWNATPKR